MSTEHIGAVVALERECQLSSRGERGYRESLQDERFLSLVVMQKLKPHEIPTLIALFTSLIIVDELQIDNIAVAASHRQKGIATLVLSRALGIARGRGTKSAVLEVRSANDAAIRLYEKSGFSAIGRRKNYYSIPPDDALIMELQLKDCP